MAAPAAAAVLALIAGAGGGAYVAPTLAGLVKGEAVVAGVYVDLGAVCKATDPLIDGLDDAFPASGALARLTAVADAVCAAAQRPDTPVDQAALAVAAIQALAAANAKIAAAAPAASASADRAGPAPPPALRGRSPRR